MVSWEQLGLTTPEEFGWNVKTYTVQKPMMGCSAFRMNPAKSD